MENLKKLSLSVVLDAYVTKNAIEDFLIVDWSKYRYNLIEKGKEDVDFRMTEYVTYLNTELSEIEEFLNDETNIHWDILGYKRDFFDKTLPKYKRNIRWFHSVCRYPFDYGVFFPKGENPLL